MQKAGLPALVVTVVALAVPSGAAAKELTNVIVVGAAGQSTVVPPSSVLSMTFDSMRAAPPARAIAGPFLLVYPLMEQGLPARPGRLYVRTRTFCGVWNTQATPTPSDCWRLTAAEARLLSTPHLVPLKSPLPRLLALRHGSTKLKFPGTPGLSGSSAWGNWLVGIELAFDRKAHARRTNRPVSCLGVHATWQGRGRPAAFCVSRTGAWADGLLYPYPTGVAQIVDVLNGRQ